MIISERRKLRMFRYVKPGFIPSDSFERKYKNQWLHILRLDMNNKFHALERPLFEKDNTPIDLFMAIHCADEVEEVYGLSMPMSEKIKLGIFVVLCIAILIVIFLIASTTGKPI